MLKKQLIVNQSRQLALHYVASLGKKLSPAEFIEEVIKAEISFASVLKQKGF
ncbi:hypothetical protein [Enterobacter sp. WCHEn045836]|uniref:hypothetical protein n=1 Tax=Enterobacter sp. WCHEn045836 TaxID=2497434 RepID=UPI00163ADF07|nr:hypothetical protein [Enterobacter sp. WCHEn045836]